LLLLPKLFFAFYTYSALLIFLHLTFFCKVHHFSKYGLSDSGEEDVPVSDKKFKPTMPLHQQQENHQKKQQQCKSDQQLLAREVSPVESNCTEQDFF
jgi:hypothetical protein